MGHSHLEINIHFISWVGVLILFSLHHLLWLLGQHLLVGHPVLKRFESSQSTVLFAFTKCIKKCLNKLFVWVVYYSSWFLKTIPISKQVTLVWEFLFKNVGNRMEEYLRLWNI